MRVRPEEETRTDYWGQDGQCDDSLSLSPTFQESQLPMGPSLEDCGDLCEERGQVCAATGAGRQVPAADINGNIQGDRWVPVCKSTEKGLPSECAEGTGFCVTQGGRPAWGAGGCGSAGPRRPLPPGWPSRPQPLTSHFFSTGCCCRGADGRCRRSRGHCRARPAWTHVPRACGGQQ